MGINKRLIEYAKSFVGLTPDVGDGSVYQTLFDSRRADFHSEVVSIDGKKYQIDFDTKKEPSLWGVERLSYVLARTVAQNTGLSLLTSSEWGALRSHVAGRNEVFEKTFWTGLAELTDTLVDYDNGLVIERPVLENGVLKKNLRGNVRAEKVVKTKVPKGVEGYICDIAGYDEFFDAVYGMNCSSRIIGDNAYIWTADKGVKVVVRANAEECDEDNRFSLDATIDLSQESEENDLFGARLCRIRCLD